MVVLHKVCHQTGIVLQNTQTSHRQRGKSHEVRGQGWGSGESRDILGKIYHCSQAWQTSCSSIFPQVNPTQWHPFPFPLSSEHILTKTTKKISFNQVCIVFSQIQAQCQGEKDEQTKLCQEMWDVERGFSTCWPSFHLSLNEGGLLWPHLLNTNKSDEVHPPPPPPPPWGMTIWQLAGRPTKREKGWPSNRASDLTHWDPDTLGLSGIQGQGQLAFELWDTKGSWPLSCGALRKWATLEMGH